MVHHQLFFVEAFLLYLEAVTALTFEEIPDYAQLKLLFKQLFLAQNYSYDALLYDWELLAYQRRAAEK